MSDVSASPIPDYGGTVFISYARADDAKPPFDDTAQGWVAFFWQQLRWELTNAGINQAELWLDRYDIDPAENFTEKIEAALKQARMIIPILSPNWVTRPWCQKELKRFLELKKEQGTANDCVVLVKKRELPESDVPIPLRDRLGYQFFTKDPGGVVREFYWRGLKDKDAYFDVLRRMAEWIAEHMMTRARAAKPARPTPGRMIYVAVPADELRDARQRLVNDLVGAGYGVLPAEAYLPDNAVHAEGVIRDALLRCEVSVHLLGDSEGMKPEGADEGIVRKQLHLAREHAGAVAAFPRILWAPKWLPEHKDTKRDPFEVVKRFGAVSAGEEVYAEEVTDLSQWLRGRLDQAKPEKPREQTLLVAGASADDDELVSMLANRLQSQEIKVKALFAGDPPRLADAATASAALVPWGKADRASIDARLSSLSVPRLVVLRLPGGDEVAKKRFFREGTYFEPLDAVPPDRKSARELLVRIDILQPNGRRPE
jgi:TIR domain